MFRQVLFVTLLFAATAAPAAATVQDFEHPSWDEEPGVPITESVARLREAHPYLADVRGVDMTNTRTVRGFSGRGLEVVVPKSTFRGFGPYARLAQPADEAWYRYHIRLDDFRPVSSGKLPGLADASRASTAKGCNPSTETRPGWSARLMFDAIGSRGAGPDEVPIGVYLYHLDQARGCGDEFMFDAALAQHRWTCIEGHVAMNTPGSNDGSFSAWVDGEPVLHLADLAFRRPGESIAIHEMWNNVYFGGSYPTPNRLRLTLDEIAVSTTGRVGCVDPFVDDNDSVHERDITELHARGLIHGCGDGRVCPENEITRAEFAALLHRVIGGPVGDDVFIDDGGHWGEGAINSLAAQRILRGCNPPENTQICPDDRVTRAEAAAMVTRALHLPDGPAAFDDITGHWAAADINALAAAGITRGCAPLVFCPDRPMTRAEAATFVLRIDDRLLDAVEFSLPEAWPPTGPPPEVPWDQREWQDEIP